ncbi:MAG: hypothetical protein DVB23_003307 [Verrucomicrobia bacterium]|nr:MAG: hypothetical protein DVB23_003307 [Verrucomicrobiota bacterium]
MFSIEFSLNNPHFSQLKMNIKLTAAILALMALAPIADAQVPAETEGTITNIVSNPGGSVTLTVMDITVTVPVGTPVSTPTSKDIGLAGLVNPTAFPGRTQAGFLGGTAIVLGNAAVDGVITADSVFAEPAENVVLGIVTPAEVGDPTGSLRVNGMLVQFLNDPRIDFDVPRNDLGFEVALAAVVPGTAVAIEGYYSTETNTFYSFLLEAVEVPALNPALQVSILRAQGRTDRGELEVRGGVSGITGAGGVTVQIRQVRPNGTTPLIGTVAAILDPLVPGTATYRFLAQGVTPFPTTVFARVVRAGVTANSDRVSPSL